MKLIVFYFIYILYIKQKPNKTMTNHRCFEHGFVVNKTHTLIKKTTHKKSIWKCNFTYNYYSNRILCRCLLFLVFKALFYRPMFVKVVRNTHRTHTEYDWSVYFFAFWLICKFHWFWRSNRFLLRYRPVKILACSL